MNLHEKTDTEARVGPCIHARCRSPKGDGACIAELLGTIDPETDGVDNGTDGDPTERYYAQPGKDIYADEHIG